MGGLKLIIRHLHAAIKAISSGWLVLILLGILFGLGQLEMLPPELGFPGAAALLLAGHFIIRDLFLSGQHSSHAEASPATHKPESMSPELETTRAWSLGLALMAVGLFVGSALYYRAHLDESRDQVRPEAGLLREREALREGHTLGSPSPEQLASSTEPDRNVNSVWVSFESQAGKAYTMVHAFRAGYIILIGRDNDHEDFSRTMDQLQEAYEGAGQSHVRGIDELMAYLDVPNGFTQKAIAAKVENWFAKVFKNGRIDAVYYYSKS